MTKSFEVTVTDHEGRARAFTFATVEEAEAARREFLLARYSVSLVTDLEAVTLAATIREAFAAEREQTAAIVAAGVTMRRLAERYETIPGRDMQKIHTRARKAAEMIAEILDLRGDR